MKSYRDYQEPDCVKYSNENRKNYGKTEWEDNNTGGKVEVTRYKDGSTTYHHGGPCGPMNYNKHGEEC